MNFYSSYGRLDLVLVGCFASAVSEARHKVWTQSVTLGLPDQWVNGRLPCPGQSISLPAEVISVPVDFGFGSKVFLPDNGILLFPDKGEADKARVLKDGR